MPTHTCQPPQAILTEDASASGMITREDVATLVCKALFSKKADNKVGVRESGSARNAVGERAGWIWAGRDKRGEPTKADNKVGVGARQGE